MADLLSKALREATRTAEESLRRRAEASLRTELEEMLTDAIKKAMVEAEAESASQTGRGSTRSLLLISSGIAIGYLLADREFSPATYEEASSQLQRLSDETTERLEPLSDQASQQVQQLSDEAATRLEQRAAEQRAEEHDEHDSTLRTLLGLSLIGGAAAVGYLLGTRRRDEDRNSKDRPSTEPEPTDVAISSATGETSHGGSPTTNDRDEDQTEADLEERTTDTV